ncbi:hypothetical protein M0805_002210 [Coniferiporia weirii]|nr:hypothetical protein M0805_002210 [Coniferiporia weirii]
MSFTEVLPSPSKSTKKQTSTILLTPRKRKCLSADASTIGNERSHGEELGNIQPLMEKNDTLSGGRSAHSRMELYKWAFTQDAIAPCFVRDVYEMKGDDASDELFWLGRVPCRSVKIVGMVVGVDQLEFVTRYKVDDGTAVVDCECRHPQQKQVLKRETKDTKPAKPTSKYKRPEESKPASKTNKDAKPSARLIPPIASVGTSVCVQGRVVRGRGSRFLRVDAGNLSVCKSSNDEPRHWLDVLRLHRESYSLDEPFVIPKPTIQPKPTSSHVEIPSNPIPSSPVTASSPSRAESSPAKSATSSPQRPRLRHPSRLRSRDLTDVTFRIYLKHYMDFAPPCRPSRYKLPRITEDDGYEDKYNSRCTTPTPSGRNKSRDPISLETPKPARHNMASGPSPAESAGDEEEEPQYGFTLSYLRRVPVLAEMARGVVRAERKRREKHEKDKASQRARSSVSQSSSRPQSVSSREGSALVEGKKPSTEPTARKVKRLYQKTIRDLYAEGSIVLWDGPRRSCSRAGADNDDEELDLEGPSCLWKTSTSVGASLTLHTSTAATSASGISTHGSALETTDELSEPDENEEAYLPITTATVSALILRTIGEITTPRSQPHPGRPTSAVGRPSGKRRRPPTAEEILSYLRTSDARWANLGNWVIEDALEKLVRDERVFKAGEGRWALCI